MYTHAHLHIPLDPPYDTFCLTEFLPTDVDHIPNVVNQPSVMATYGYQHDHMTSELAREWVEGQVAITPNFRFSGRL